MGRLSHQENPQPALNPTDPTGNLNFIAWFDAETTGTEYAWPYTLTENVTMHAQWTSDYIVNFYPLGGSPAPARQFASNNGTETVNTPAGMTVSGALFEGTVSNPTIAQGGWYTEDTYSTAWNFGNPVNGNLNLYAKWTVDTTNTAINVSGQSGANILDKALNYMAGKNLAGSTAYTIVLNENCSLPGIPIDPANPSAVSANITNPNAVITLMGKSATNISLSSNGALFVITAGGLVLDKNITLTGRASNNSSLVIVYRSSASPASLTMQADAKITGNTSASIPGGGVMVYGGAFTMSGGEISGNAATGHGGGVVVNNGSFTMSGTAKISGNKASASGGNGGGGGVVISDDSSFTMSGAAEISGNTTGYSGQGNGEGGGVLINDYSSFTMDGGEISGNSTTGYDGGGGGVAVTRDSTFTMKTGAKISGNYTALVVEAGGGGVIVNHNGTFRMEGGEISGNRVTPGSVYGNGVGGGVAIVNNSNFSKTGGILYGDSDHVYGNGGNTTDNTAPTIGNAVWYWDVEDSDNPVNDNIYYRDTTLIAGDNINTNTVPSSGAGGNWIKVVILP